MEQERRARQIRNQHVLSPVPVVIGNGEPAPYNPPGKRLAGGVRNIDEPAATDVSEHNQRLSIAGMT